MLILTRRLDETLRIGDDVTLTILGVRGKQVRIGVNAPRSVPVHRQETCEPMRRELAAQAPFPRNEMAEEGADQRQGSQLHNQNPSDRLNNT
ncbi:MAG: carbon storage regulator CsrA [Gammaproteobacteria bacterium]|nr:MAG: carbon storage regulator CsrA [Gammaproteobacteria bacterium]TLZ36434.1 MAG: carbon storage regulator CsrA [Gammaproteobacteria bacterium]